jgi:hypothetical protein
MRVEQLVIQLGITLEEALTCVLWLLRKRDQYNLEIIPCFTVSGALKNKYTA